MATDFLLSYPQIQFTRGNSVDQRIRPDAELWINGQHFFVEVDTGQQSYSQVRRRQRFYASVSDLLLYVTASERRLQGLVRESGQVKEIALFTVLGRVIRDPHGEIWQDLQGKTVSLTGVVS